MAELIKKILCPDSECVSEAALMSDKRGKLYVECPTCGSLKYNRNQGQERLKKLLEDQGVDVAAVESEILGDEPEVTPEDIPNEDEKEGGKGGLIVLGLGLLGGGLAWLKMRKA